MNQITIRPLLFFIVFCSFYSKAQVINSKILDSITQEPIPYVTIQWNNRGVISNEEGRFSLLLNNTIKATDSIIISCIGFETILRPLKQFQDSIIYLKPKAIELKEIVLTNKQYTAEEIIEKAKENVDKNYNFDLTKKRMFFRESNHQNFVKTNYTLEKSTIDALNKSFLDSVMQSVPKNNSYYTEILCDLYGNFNKDKQKMDLIKASELYDKNMEVSFTALEDKFNKIIEENVKSDSYFKIKSGVFGDKVEMDEFMGNKTDSTDAEALKKKLEEEKKSEADKKENFAKYRKSSFVNMMNDLFFQDKTNINFFRKSGKYDFKVLELNYLGDDVVYVLEFIPKGSADYKGTLYINSDDFAIIRLDYENVKPLKNFRLLGISYRIYLTKGKMIFSKEKNDRYSLQYLEREIASRFGIQRPLKIIEKNKNVKGRRKQNELFVKLDMAITARNKYEAVIFDTEHVTSSEFNSFKENNTMLPTYMPAYNPEFWKGYNIIEPNQAIREFVVIE